MFHYCCGFALGSNIVIDRLTAGTATVDIFLLDSCGTGRWKRQSKAAVLIICPPMSIGALSWQMTRKTASSRKLPASPARRGTNRAIPLGKLSFW